MTIRLREPWADKPGTPSCLGAETEIESEQDWHDVFKQRMENAGWTLKHEVVCNQNQNRVDFLGYHSELNPSYENGEWVGFELKYGRLDNSNAVSAATQIENKYRDKTWLSSGEKVSLWVVAPYITQSHEMPEVYVDQLRNHIPKDHLMTESRAVEIQSAELLNQLGYGYLFSWHPAPHIAFATNGNNVPYPKFDTHAHMSGVPAFEGGLDPFEIHTDPAMCPTNAAECRVKYDSGGLSYDRRRAYEAYDKAQEAVRNE